MPCNRSGVLDSSKSEPGTVCTFEGILSSSITPGSVADTFWGPGAAATAAGVGWGGARRGGATGVVGTTRISGSDTALELVPEVVLCCAVATAGASTAANTAARTEAVH